MIVARSGFSKPAIAKAAALGIQARTLAEVGELDWLPVRHITQKTRHARDFNVFLDVGRSVDPASTQIVFDNEGNTVDNALLVELANSALAQLPKPIEEDVGSHERQVTFDKPGWRVQVDHQVLEVRWATVTVRYEVEELQVPLIKYHSELHGDGLVISHGVASLNVGTLVLSEQPDGSTIVTFSPPPLRPKP